MKKIFYPLVVFMISFFLLSQAQTLKAQKDSTTNNSSDLLNDLSENQDTVNLLPNHFLPTQRIFWGKHGLMRNFSYFKLTPENRQRELKVRRTMLVAHQALGSLTLLGMIGQGIVGTKLYNGDRKMRGLHENLAAAVDIGYFTTASLSLFAPPKMFDERKGFSTIKIHKYLAIVHFTSMVATNVLASQLEGNPQLKKWHRAAAFTAFGAFAAAMIVIKF
jgi:hypothetical protein